MVKRFHLERDTDVTGISGEGRVAEGCQFSDGCCALTWLTEHTSYVFYQDIRDVEFIHGHNGSTRIVFDD